MGKVTRMGLRRRGNVHVCKQSVRGAAHLSHVDAAHSQGLVAQNGSVLVALPPLQHDLELVALSLQKVRVLRWETQWKSSFCLLAVSPKLHGSPPFPRNNPRALLSAHSSLTLK